MSTYKLKIIVASTRPGRKGPILASWIREVAEGHPQFSVEVLDMADINLPFLDEPHHPRLQKYEHQHTKDWSRMVDEADAFIMVIPEYNFGFSAPLKNALDFLFNEWAHKPVGLVSYGGVSAGTRAVQMLKQVLTALKMMPITESVNIPFFTKHINDEDKFIAEEGLTASAEGMLRELLRWTEALKPMRQK